MVVQTCPEHFWTILKCSARDWNRIWNTSGTLTLAIQAINGLYVQRLNICYSKSLFRKRDRFQELSIVLMRKHLATCTEAVLPQPYPQSWSRAQRLTRSMCCRTTCGVPPLLYSSFRYGIFGSVLQTLGWISPLESRIMANMLQNFVAVCFVPNATGKGLVLHISASCL